MPKYKELLLALSQGVHVVGGASMGALRAAELYPFGMEGVGEIFEWFRDGVIEADDEVAVIHSSAENLLTLYGGKLTSYRVTAEKVMRHIQKVLPAKNNQQASTKEITLR